MNDFIKWLTTSSQDPTKTSLFIKGALTAAAPVAMFAFGFTEADYAPLVEAVEKAVFYGLSLLSMLMVLWGMGRKIASGRWAHPNYDLH